ncbi:helix-turn-helix domain-containing protein [Streptomyces sp. NPDC005227]|uniref:helix-turn-helix domain-containing protein n=1 Tax=Streptomyces sp. NPDC005227 TaxID=3364707 RepID=UPI0036D1C5CE
MTDAPQDRKEHFFAVVLPALKRAGYLEYGAQTRLSAETGMNPGTVSRLVRGKTIPDVEALPPLAKAIGVGALDLLVAAGYLPDEYLESHQPLSETNQSQVGSRPITPEEAADELGITDDVGRAIFLGMVDRLKNSTPGDGQEDEASGGTAAQM